MRDKCFITIHRGGTLTREQHCQLIKWASVCASHVLPLIEEPVDERLTNALQVAREWELGNATVGEARNASLEAIAVANESTNPTVIAVARSVGHAVATAHMADHSLRAAEYALKAIKLSGKSVETEQNWQNLQLPPEIRKLISSGKLLVNVGNPC
jgi:hypothetical protein